MESQGTQNKPKRGENMSKLITHNHNDDGVDRRGFLQCMAWAGTGVLWTVGSGVLTSQAFGKNKTNAAKSQLHFVQISDSHMGLQQAREPRCNRHPSSNH